MPSEELRSKENNPGDECRKEPPSPADISSSESCTELQHGCQHDGDPIEGWGG